MTLESHLNEVLELLLHDEDKSSISVEQLIRSIDLTLLDEQAPIELLSQLNQDGQRNQVAAVCVYSKHLPQFQGINRATVINFPQGTENISHSLQAIETAIHLEAKEIDYVLPYPVYLEGQKQKALHFCQEIINFCTEQGVCLKIILETGAFSHQENIYEISRALCDLGCDFIKTSTGKIAQGATLSAVFTILCAIKDSGNTTGIKVSGGVKTVRQALSYAQLAELMLNKPIDKNWFRIGASSLLHELLAIRNLDQTQ